MGSQVEVFSWIPALLEIITFTMRSVLVISVLSFNQLLMTTSADSPIINLCCPEQHAHKKGNKEKIIEKKHRCEEDQEPIVERSCFPHSNKSQLVWKDLIWEEGKQLEEEAGTYFQLASPPDNFICPKEGESLAPFDIVIGSSDIRTYINGSITGHLEDRDDVTFNTSQYCIAFTDAFNSEESDNVKTSYFVCVNFGEAVEETKSVYIFYPISIFISCFFILLTICIYMTVQDLRNNIFGKLTLGFLFNVCIAYFFTGVHHSLYFYNPQGDLYLGSSFCVFLGYIIQHTWIAFFFWTNAMAINITRKFSNIMVSSQEPETTGMLILNVLFAQGSPLMISIVTAFMDSYGDCGDVLPHMGHYNCFPGGENDPNQSLETTSEFLYFYLIIIVSISINIICFLLTAFFLTSHWRSVQMMQTSAENSVWSHLMLLLKLFIIMGKDSSSQHFIEKLLKT